MVRLEGENQSPSPESKKFAIFDRWPMRFALGGLVLINTMVSGKFVSSMLQAEGSSATDIGLVTASAAFLILGAGYCWRQFEHTQNSFDRTRKSIDQSVIHSREILTRTREEQTNNRGLLESLQATLKLTHDQGQRLIGSLGVLRSWSGSLAEQSKKLSDRADRLTELSDPRDIGFNETPPQLPDEV